MDIDLERILVETLRFEYLSGDVTPIFHPHTTGWRVLPGLMCSQIYRGIDEIVLDEKVRVPVPTGSLMLLAAGVHHRIDLMAPDGLARWVHVNFYVMNNLDLFSLIDLPPVAPAELGDAVGEAIEDFLAEHRRAGADRLYLTARVQEFGFHLLGLLAGVWRVKTDASEKLVQRRQLTRVIEHMHAHFQEPMGRDDLAKLACLSPAQFHRTFQMVAGMTPVAYLRRLRIRQAQQRLLSTSVSVSDIAAEVGYDDIFVFSKCFKRLCGVSPSEYRAALHDLRG